MNYKLVSDDASVLRLKRSVTPDLEDISARVSGDRKNLSSASAIASAETSSRITPLMPSLTTSPQKREAITGTFHDWASSCVNPKPSESVGRINTSASL